MPDVPRLLISGISSRTRRKGYLQRWRGPVAGTTEVLPDIVPPTLFSSTPANGATDVTGVTEIVLTFDEAIQFGTGRIILRENDGGWGDVEIFQLPGAIGVGPGTVSISGNNLYIRPTLALAPSREHSIRMWTTAIDDLAGNSYAGIANDTTVAFTTASAVVPNQSAFFPSDTAANSGGFKPFDESGDEQDVTEITDQTGVTGTLAIVDGSLVFTSGTPASSDGDVAVIVAGGVTLTITIDASVPGHAYRSWTEFAAAVALGTDGEAFYGRPGSYTVVGGNGYFDGLFNDLTDRAVFGACRTDEEKNYPVFDRFVLYANTAPVSTYGKVTIQNMKFHRDTTEDDKLTGNITGSVSGLIQLEQTNGGPDDVIIQDCLFSSNYPIARITGTRPADTIYGVWCKEGSNVIIRRCKSTYLAATALIDDCDTFEFRENLHTYCWDDMIKVVSACSNFKILDNEAHSFIGDHGYHPDYIHLYQDRATGMDTAEIAGNVGYPNVEGCLAPAWPTSDISGALTREGSYNTANRTLTDADQDLFIICDVTSGDQTISLSDPTASGGIHEMAVQLRAVGGSVSNSVTIDADGYTLYDIDNDTNITSWDLIEPWECVLLRVRPGENRWSLKRVGAIYQGLFTNANTNGYTNFNIHDNIFWTTGAVNGIRVDGVNSDTVTVTRNLMPTAWPGDLNGSGRPNSHANGGPNVAGQFDYDGTNGVVSFSLGAALAGTFTGSDNALSADVDVTVWADMVANFNVANAGTQVHFPTTKLQAVEMARPVLGSYLLNNGIGPLGETTATDVYNFGQLVGDLGPVVGAPTELNMVSLLTSTFVNQGQRTVETVTTDVAASGNWPVRVMVAFRHSGAGGTNQNITAQIGATSITDRKEQHGTSLECVVFDIPSGAVPAGTFTVTLTNNTANWNGISVQIIEMEGAADDQSTAQAVGSFSATGLTRDVLLTTVGDNNGVTYVACPQTAGVSLTGTPAPTVIDVSSDTGNGVTYGMFGYSKQTTAGATAGTFTQTSVSNIAVMGVEVLFA